ncbi:MAG: 16S rRNA (uracil(1498)-N(3))-methyltransferase [Gammaproteobacteria bacterium]|nr:16S rRNA (uracil(1498)-N(3))-methyltransferase [Gammaproteobacteria bacterium]
MRIPRIYTDQALTCKQSVILESAAASHIHRVLRLKAGAELILFNGLGGEYKAIIESANKRQITIQLTQHSTNEIESPLDITLVQGISRGERMDYTIQKAVELGVTRIVPIKTQRCTVKLDDTRAKKRIAHWQKIIISACEQCGRNQIPVIENVTTYEKWLTREHSALNLILDPTANSTVTQLKKPTTAINLMIGPEGGFDDKELNLAKIHKYTGIRLGPRILRTETAAITALSVLQTLWGDI